MEESMRGDMLKKERKYSRYEIEEKNKETKKERNR